MDLCHGVVGLWGVVLVLKASVLARFHTPASHIRLFEATSVIAYAHHDSNKIVPTMILNRPMLIRLI